jgi:hypothetical protein
MAASSARWTSPGAQRAGFSISDAHGPQPGQRVARWLPRPGAARYTTTRKAVCSAKA